MSFHDEYDVCKPGSYDYDDYEDEDEDERSLLYDDLADDAEDYHHSEEDGWFYDD